MGEAKIKQRAAFAPKLIEEWEAENCVNFAVALARLTGWLLHVDWWSTSPEGQDAHTLGLNVVQAQCFRTCNTTSAMPSANMGTCPDVRCSRFVCNPYPARVPNRTPPRRWLAPEASAFPRKHRKMIEFRQLRYFTTIVDASSITRASSILHIAQPALSQQIRDLETQLGVKLLNRSIKGVVPTLEGVALYSHAKNMLSLRDQTQEVIKKAGGVVSGRVRLGIPSSISMILASPLLRILRKNYPEVLLELYESPSTYLATQLLDGRVDLSLLVDRLPAADLTVLPLVTEKVFLVQAAGSPLFLGRKSVNFAELSDVDLMLTTRASTLRGMVEKYLKKAKVNPRIKAEASSIQTLLTVVADSGVSTIIPYSALSWHPVQQVLRSLPILPSFERNLSVAHCTSAPLSPAAQCVRELIVKVCTRLVNEKIWLGASLSASKSAALDDS